MARDYIKIFDRYPLGLTELIADLNELPRDLERFESDLTDLKVKFNSDFHASNFEKPDDIEQLTRKYSAELRRLVKPKLVTKVDTILALARSKGFESEIIVLRKLANEKITLLSIIRGYEFCINHNTPAQDFNFDKSIVAFGFNSDSTLRVTSFRIIELLNKVPIKRFLICPICQKIVLTKKTNAQTCGDKNCADAQGNKKRTIKSKKGK